jgi:hypothetical protein
MVSLVDTVDGLGDLAAIEKELTEAVAQSASSTKAGTSLANTPQTGNNTPIKQTLEGDDVPVKLRGKSLEEVAAMYANLESAYGRQANDLGTQRKLTDRLLDLKRESDLTSNSPRRELPSVRTNDLLENPAEVIDNIVSERVRAIQSENAAQLSQMEASLARDKFVAKHNDYQDVANDPEFVSWIQKSSYRMRAASAAYNGDWAAADELVSDYKERKPAPRKEDPATNTEHLEAARAASLESGVAPEGASTKKGKTYKRTDLMRLRVEKPDLYYSDEYQAEILRAYAEKRVV